MKAKPFTAIAVALLGLCAATAHAQTTTTNPPKGDASYGMQTPSSASSGATRAERKAARAERTAAAKADAKASGTKTEASIGMQPASSASSGRTAADRKAARAARTAEGRDAAKKGDAAKTTPN